MKESTGTACSPLVTPPSSKSSNSSTSSNDSTNTPASSVTEHESAKTDFVEALVDTSCVILQSIWTTTSRNNNNSKISLRSYIQELLKRSRTSYSTLQIALYYLCKRITKAKIATSEPRRTFLSALLIASKYNQDRTYSAGAWSKMSGLTVIEINRNELELLKAMDWNAHISYIEYGKWCNELLQMSLISHKRRRISNSAFDSVEPSAAIKSLAAVATNTDNNSCATIAIVDSNTTVSSGTKRKADFDDIEPTLFERKAHAKERQIKNYRIYQWIVDVARESSNV